MRAEARPTSSLPAWLIPPGRLAIEAAAARLAREGHAVLLAEETGFPATLPPALPGEIAGPRRPGHALRRRIARAVASAFRGVQPETLRIGATDDGAPRFESLPELHLSLSTRDGLSLIGLGTVPLGVDLETMIAAEAIPWNMLRPDERGTLRALPEGERAAAFVRLWSAKEAVAKALRRGFILPPESLTIGADGTFAIAAPFGSGEPCAANLQQAWLGPDALRTVSFALLPKQEP